MSKVLRESFANRGSADKQIPSIISYSISMQNLNHGQTIVTEISMSINSGENTHFKNISRYNFQYNQLIVILIISLA